MAIQENLSSIDWKKIWEEQMLLSSWTKDGEQWWDKRAEAFDRNIKNKEYIDEVLEKVDITPDSTVLDIGCGPGTLAIPLAKRVKAVTALDLSGEMLQYVAKNAKSEGLNNITCLKKNWEDVIVGKDVNPHDVVICSRAFPERDPLQAIKLMNNAATKYVYIVMWANGDEYENFFRLTYGNIGKKYLSAPDYIYVYNMLCQEGIFANVEYVNYVEKLHYQNIDIAMDDWVWRIRPENDGQKNRLENHLLKYFVRNNGFLNMELNCRWAFLWWKKG